MKLLKSLKYFVLGGMAAAAIAVVIPSTAVTAAPKEEPLKEIFDAQYYADQNPDVKEAFGNDEELLYKHFLEYGLQEGRVVSPLLDLKAYRRSNPDLEEAFGDDWSAYAQHFLEYGMIERAEGRRGTAGIKFNPVVYAAAYPDVKEACGDNLLAITKHYMTQGIAEGRTAGTPPVRSSKSKISSSASAPAVSKAPATSGGEDPKDEGGSGEGGEDPDQTPEPPDETPTGSTGETTDLPVKNEGEN